MAVFWPKSMIAFSNFHFLAISSQTQLPQPNVGLVLSTNAMFNLIEHASMKQNFGCYWRKAKFWLLLKLRKILDTAQENQSFGYCFREQNLICVCMYIVYVTKQRNKIFKDGLQKFK